MSVSLVKEYTTHTFPYGMDNEAWNSRVLLPMYISTIYDSHMAYSILNSLRMNNPTGFAELLFVSGHLDNSTGKLV